MNKIQVINQLKYVYNGRTYDSLRALESAERDIIDNTLVNYIESQNEDGVGRDTPGPYYREIMSYRHQLTHKLATIKTKILEMDEAYEDLDNALRAIRWEDRKK